MDGWLDGGGWVDGWMDEWMDGWMNGWMDGWMDGWMWSPACCHHKWAQRKPWHVTVICSLDRLRLLPYQNALNFIAFYCEMDGLTDGRTDGRMYGWIDGRTDRWTYRQTSQTDSQIVI